MGISYSMADLYPGMSGYYTTRTTTVPEAEDQTALVDDEELAKETSIHTTPQKHRNIFLSIITVIVVMFVFSKFS
jgi:hypothetical protein